VPEPPHSGVIHAAPGRQAAIPPPERGGHQGWAGRVTGCDSKHPAGCQHDAAGVLHRRQQVDRAAEAVGPAGGTGRLWPSGWVGAAQRLAVDGHRPPPWPLRGGGVVVAVACDQPKDRAPADTWSQPGRENTADSASLPIGGVHWSAKARGPDVARKWPPHAVPQRRPESSGGSSAKTCRTTLRAVQPGRYLAVGAPSPPDAWPLPAPAFSRSAAS
jgi:hypothetical protein